MTLAATAPTTDGSESLATDIYGIVGPSHALDPEDDEHQLVGKRPAAARLQTVAAAGHLPTSYRRKPRSHIAPGRTTGMQAAASCDVARRRSTKILLLTNAPLRKAGVIRALRYLRDKAGRNRAARNAVERELAFFRKHRKRMRYRDLSDRRLAIGSGVVEAANKILVTQRMKRSGMRWRIHGGQAVLTVRALIKSGRFDRAWNALMGKADTPANDNIRNGNDARLVA